MAIFKQDDFSAGLNTQFDPGKAPDGSYPLLINGRVRQNIIAPTTRHVELDVPVGSLQGLYVIGSFMVLFVSGKAYYADITSSPVIFYPVGNWNDMEASVSRIYAELVPASNNKFNRTGTPDDSVRVFNNSIAIFPEVLMCFDGVSQGQAIKPTMDAVTLGEYASWTQSAPDYVPVGKIPAFCNNKLFLTSPDNKKVFHSVSGRAHDFMVNLDVAGNAGGDADTVSTTVSYNDITAMRSLSSGQVLVGTLYSTHIIELDYTTPVFGEPYLRPITIFPAGIVNELSIIDVLNDTAFITQTGINKFNAVMQSKRESNNTPFGAKIRGLLTNPFNDDAIIQADTCAGLYNDYALFAVNTTFGYGVIVYDTVQEIFHALDLSFGRVKQFAPARFAGQERLFYITHENKLFEAFASDEVEATRVYLGDFTPNTADQDLKIDMVNLQFTNVRTSGHVKVSVYADKKLFKEAVIDVEVTGFTANLPLPIPFPEATQGVAVDYALPDKARAWRIGLLIEWNFDGCLTDVSLGGSEERGDSVRLDTSIEVAKERYAFLADSGYSIELNPGGNFSAEGFVMLTVIDGHEYVYFANGNGALTNGFTVIEERGVFTANDGKVVISGSGAMTFSLRDATNYIAVLKAIDAEKITDIWHGGDFAYEDATRLDVEMAALPLNVPMIFAPGNHDVVTEAGKYFFNLMHQTRYGYNNYGLVGVFFYNGNASEPDGHLETSLQAGHLRNWLRDTSAIYKFIVVHHAPYSNDVNHSPGRTDLRFLGSLGAHGVFSGHAHNMELFVVNNFPFFVNGAGGHSLRGFVSPLVEVPVFQNDTSYGYLTIEADRLTCRVSFKDIAGAVLHVHDVHP